MILVECYADMALVRSLTGIPRREIDHEFGKGNICNRLRDLSGCTGLVDEDPSAGQPSYLKEARVAQDLVVERIKVLQHDATGNRVIVLCPRLEEWILDGAKGAGVDVRDYGLPNDPLKLHSQINLNLGRFGELVEKLRGSSTRLKALEELLKSDP